MSDYATHKKKSAATHSWKAISKKKIVVDIKLQSLVAIENEKEVFSFRCVTGDADHPTPKGKYHILGKEKTHFSQQYQAQMNFAMRLTSSGIFIHEGYNYIKNPADQNSVATMVSDSAAAFFSYSRHLFPEVAKVKINIGNINLTGSHGCIRLKHTDAVKLFDWTSVKTEVEVK